MEKMLKELFSLERLWISTLILWIYRIGVVLIIVGGILHGLSSMEESFSEGLFLIVIATPIAVLWFRISVEIIFLLVGIYNKLCLISEALGGKNSAKETPPDEFAEEEYAAENDAE